MLIESFLPLFRQYRRWVMVGALCALRPSAGDAQQAAPTPSRLERSVDPKIRPGDDFFEYANGAWLHATSIPAGKPSWGPRGELEIITRARIATILDAARSAPAGSIARKVADYQAAYLDAGEIERRGLAPLRPFLDSVGRVRDREGLARLLGQGMHADVDPLNWGIFQGSAPLGLSVEMTITGDSMYTPFLVQGGLGLPDREDYLASTPEAAALRLRYQGYVERMFVLAGFDHARERAAAVVALETALAGHEATPEASAQDHNADTVWTRADFARRAPGLDWNAYFAAAGLAHQATFVPWQPSAVTGFAALVASEPLAAWRDYLRFHALDHYADLLPRPFADAALAMHGTADTSRVQRALDATQAALSEAIGQLYMERYFPAWQQKRVQQVVDNVAAAFRRRVEASTWMTPATKAIALAKLQTLYIGMGGPAKWPDWSDLAIDPKDALGNARRVEARALRLAVAKLGHPADRTEWIIAPQRVGAILTFQQNAYEFSAALLQSPKFDSLGSEAATYGSIGALVGHDVSHYVDVLGAEYEPSGRERRWWTPADSAHFDALAQPLVDQYSAYRPLPDLAIDGRRTRTENVADLAGLDAAFDAYRAALGSRATDSSYLRAQDREFFLAYGQSYRSLFTDAALRHQVTTDIHAPDRWRIATVRNLDAWYDAFDVRPGDRLYLAPADRVRVW